MAGPPSEDRVLPDTSAFGRSLERYVQRIEKSLRIDIPTSADFKGVQDDIDRFREQQQKDPVDVPVKPVQLDDFQRRIKAEVSKLSRDLEAKIPITAQGEKFRAEATAQIEGLQKLLNVKVPLSLEGKLAFREQVLAQLAEVEAIAKGTHPTIRMRVDVDKSIFQQMRSLEGALGVAKDAADKAVSALGGITDAGFSAFGVLGKIPPVALGIAAALTLAAPLAADLVATLGPGLLTALPAMLGAGAALGVMALGADKLKGAFKPITDQVDGLKKSIGTLLAAGVRPLVSEFVDKAMPTIQSGLGAIARTMNGFIKDFLTWAQSAPTVRLIGSLFAGINAAMKPLSGVATALGDALLRIAKDATPALRLVSQTIADLATRFDTFIKSKDKDGSLTKTITDSVVAAGKLIGALVNLGGAIGRLFADIGKGSTKSLSDGINGIADAIDRFNKNGGGKEIRDFLVQVGDAIKTYFSSGDFKKTADDLKTFAQNAKDLTQDLKDLVDTIKGIKEKFDSLGGGALGAPFTDALNPVGHLIELVNNLKATGPGMWDGVQSSTANAWANVNTTVSNWWGTITGTITSAGASVGTAIGNVWGGAKQQTADAWSNITTTVSNAWGGVVTFLSEKWAEIQGIFSAGAGILRQIWDGFWNSDFGGLVKAGFGLVLSIVNLNWIIINGIFQGATQGLTSITQGAWNGIASITSTAWGGISGTISTWWGSITGTVKNKSGEASSSVGSAWSRVTTTTSTSWANVSSTTSTWWGTIYTTVSTKAASIWGSVTAWFGRVRTSITDAFQGAYNGAVQWIQNLIGKVEGLGATIQEKVSNFGTTLFNAGAQLIQGLIDGMTSKIQAVTNTINSIADKIKGFFPGSPVKEGPLTSWNNGGAGKRLVAMLVTGLSDTSSVESAMTSLAGKVATPLTASALAPAASGAGSVAAGGVNVYVTNPVPETASESTTRIMRRLAVLGPAALPATA